MNLKKEFSIMWKFYLRTALTPFTNLTWSIIIIYFLTIGFNPSLVGLLWSASTFFIVLFELPTGVVADVFGRKISTCIGILMNAVAILILVFTINPWIIFVSFVLSSIGFTFISGARDAWFVDYFLHYGNKKYLNRVISRKKSIFLFFGFLVHVLASVVLLIFKDTYGLVNVTRALFLIESIFMFLAFIIALFTKEPYFKKRQVKTYFRDEIKEARITIKKSIREVKNNKRLFYIFIASAIFFFGSTAISMGWNVHLNNNGIDESFLGLIFAAAFLISFIVIFFNEKIVSKIGIKKTISYSVLLLGISYLFFSFNFGLYLIPIYLIFAGILWDLWETNLSVRMNKVIPSKIRATVLSLKSVFDFFPTMLGEILLFGLVTELFSLNVSLFIGSLFFFVSVFFFNKV